MRDVCAQMWHCLDWSSVPAVSDRGARRYSPRTDPFITHGHVVASARAKAPATCTAYAIEAAA